MRRIKTSGIKIGAGDPRTLGGGGISSASEKWSPQNKNGGVEMHSLEFFLVLTRMTGCQLMGSQTWSWWTWYNVPCSGSFPPDCPIVSSRSIVIGWTTVGQRVPDYTSIYWGADSCSWSLFNCEVLRDTSIR